MKGCLVRCWQLDLTFAPSSARQLWWLPPSIQGVPDLYHNSFFPSLVWVECWEPPSGAVRTALCPGWSPTSSSRWRVGVFMRALQLPTSCVGPSCMHPCAPSIVPLVFSWSLLGTSSHSYWTASEGGSQHPTHTRGGKFKLWRRFGTPWMLGSNHQSCHAPEGAKVRSRCQHLMGRPFTRMRTTFVYDPIPWPRPSGSITKDYFSSAVFVLCMPWWRLEYLAKTYM